MRMPSRLKGKALGVVTFVVCLLAMPAGLTADDTAPAIPPKDFTDAPQHVVVRVVSGDTVIVRIDGKARRIRLIGVEASPLSTSAGRSSGQFLENLLKGEKVYVERPADQPDTDEFGRQPAYLYRAPDGLFVNLEMVRQGYATVADKSAFEHKKLFEHYADKAKLHKKGMWRPAADDANEVAKVEGTDTSNKEEGQSGRLGRRHRCIHHAERQEVSPRRLLPSAQESHPHLARRGQTARLRALLTLQAAQVTADGTCTTATAWLLRRSTFLSEEPLPELVVTIRAIQTLCVPPAYSVYSIVPPALRIAATISRDFSTGTCSSASP